LQILFMEDTAIFEMLSPWVDRAPRQYGSAVLAAFPSRTVISQRSKSTSLMRNRMPPSNALPRLGAGVRSGGARRRATPADRTFIAVSTPDRRGGFLARVTSSSQGSSAALTYLIEQARLRGLFHSHVSFLE